MRRSALVLVLATSTAFAGTTSTALVTLTAVATATTNVDKISTAAIHAYRGIKAASKYTGRKAHILRAKKQ